MLMTSPSLSSLPLSLPPNPHRDNSGIHSSPSNHIFDTLQSPSSTTGYSSNPYSSGPAHSMPLTTYGGTIPVTVGNEEILGGGARGMATNSMFSENVNSHTSTPIHGTLASTSLFGSEEQTSVTTQLPNFPRANLQVRIIMCVHVLNWLYMSL